MITAPPNLPNSDWSQNETDISLRETFSTNVDSYYNLESLASYPTYEFDCLVPETLCMSTDVELATQQYPPLTPVSLLRSAESHSSQSSIGVVAYLATHSSISEIQPQIPDDTSYIDSVTETKTTSLYDENFTETPFQYGDKPILPKEQASCPEMESDNKLVTRSTQGQRFGQTRLNKCSVAKGHESHKTKKLRKSRKIPVTKEQEELKREKFLERNRIAANKCRQNRKKWIDDLQEKCERISTENTHNKAALEEMSRETLHLRRKVEYLKRICSIIYEMPPDLRFTITQQPKPGELGFSPESEGLCDSRIASHIAPSGKKVDGLSSHSSSPAFSSQLPIPQNY